MASVGRTAGICYSRHSPSITSLNFSTPVKHCLTMPPFSPFSAFKSLTCCLAKSKQAIRATPSPLRPILGISSHSLCALVVAGRAYHGNWSAPPQAAAYEQQGTAEFPRPPVMHWEKDLANAVMLIGYVGRDVDIRYIDSGKVVARTSIAVRTSSVKDEEPSCKNNVKTDRFKAGRVGLAFKRTYLSSMWTNKKGYEFQLKED